MRKLHKIEGYSDTFPVDKETVCLSDSQSECANCEGTAGVESANNLAQVVNGVTVVSDSESVNNYRSSNSNGTTAAGASDNDDYGLHVLFATTDVERAPTEVSINGGHKRHEIAFQCVRVNSAIPGDTSRQEANPSKNQYTWSDECAVAHGPGLDNTNTPTVNATLVMGNKTRVRRGHIEMLCYPMGIKESGKYILVSSLTDV